MPANIPYGNAFLVNTPALNQLEQRLYMEEKQRQQQNINAAKALDDEFAKNVSGIRDADVPRLEKEYRDYKFATQEGMKRKDGLSPKEQMELLQKKARMYKTINESKAEREREEMDAKRYSTKPDDFDDKAPEYMMQGRRLPLEQKRAYITKDENGNQVQIDLTNPEIYRWRDKTNWQPILQKAGGILTQRGQPVQKPLEGGLEVEETTYKGGNDPLEYYNGILGAMTTPRASQSLSTRYKFTPEEAQDITLKFEELKKSPDFKNAYGDIKFPESSSLSEGARTAKLLAMVNALNNPPVATTKRVKDVKAISDYNRGENEAMRKRLAKYNSDLIEGRQRRNPYSGINYQEGILFDTIGETNPVSFQSGKPKWAGGVSGKIINGYAYDENDKPVTGDIEIDAADLPSLMISVLKEQKVNVPTAGKVKFTAKDGTITTLKTGTTGQVDRNAMKVYQLFKNKEPIKGEQPNFGKTNNILQPVKKPTKKKPY